MDSCHNLRLSIRRHYALVRWLRYKSWLRHSCYLPECKPFNQNVWYRW